MELKKIQYFLRIVEKGSLSKAAESLYLTQPTLSRFLSRLEEEAGTKLFFRGRDNSLTLTENGRRYLETARKIDALWNELQTELQKEQGEILLGIDSDSIYPFVLACADRLTERFPGYSVRILRHGAERAQALVADGELDLAVTAYADEDERLTYLPLRSVEVQLIVSRQNPLARLAETGVRVRLETLPPHLPFVLICEATVLRTIEDRYFARHGYEPQIRRTYSRHPSVLEIISGSAELLGFCPAVYVTDQVAALSMDPPFYYRSGICFRRNTAASPAVRYLTGLLQGQES